jgi:hypothetical protein
LEGSLKNPALTLSHHLEISPIACSFEAAGPHPLDPKITNKIPVERTAINEYVK